MNDGRERVDDEAMLWTCDELGEVHWLRRIGVILAETFAAVVGDFAREDFILEDLAAELKYDGNDVAEIDVIVVFDTIDEGVDDPFDDGLPIEEALVEQHAQQTVVIVPLAASFVGRLNGRWRGVMHLRCRRGVLRSHGAREAVLIVRLLGQMARGHLRNGCVTLALHTLLDQAIEYFLRRRE